MPSFVNLRVIVALMMREMSTRYGRSAGGYLWALLEPAGMILILAIVFSLALRTPSLGSSFVLFYATGYFAFHFYVELSSFAASAINMNRPLLTYPRVTPIDAIIARALLQFFTLAVAAIIILSGIVAWEEVYTVYDFVAIIKAAAYSSLLGVGVGSTNAVIFAFFPTYINVYRILTRPLFLISGVIFTYEELPGVAQDLLWWNPILHCAGLMRRGFYPTYHASYVSELYVVGLGLGFLTIGLFLVWANKTYLIEQS